MMTRKKLTLSEAEDALGINPDDLDSCLVEQPDLFYHVAQSHTDAASVRDLAKYEMENVNAELDDLLRTRAVKDQEKVTEALLQQRIRLQPKMKEATRKYLEAKAEADRWAVLKESFQQRSFMMKELVERQVSQLYVSGGAAGYSSREKLVRAMQERSERSRTGTR